MRWWASLASNFVSSQVRRPRLSANWDALPQNMPTRTVAAIKKLNRRISVLLGDDVNGHRTLVSRELPWHGFALLARSEMTHQ